MTEIQSPSPYSTLPTKQQATNQPSPWLSVFRTQYQECGWKPSLNATEECSPLESHTYSLAPGDAHPLSEWHLSTLRALFIPKPGSLCIVCNVALGCQSPHIFLHPGSYHPGSCLSQSCPSYDCLEVPQLAPPSAHTGALLVLENIHLIKSSDQVVHKSQSSEASESHSTLCP